MDTFLASVLLRHASWREINEHGLNKRFQGCSCDLIYTQGNMQLLKLLFVLQGQPLPWPQTLGRSTSFYDWGWEWGVTTSTTENTGLLPFSGQHPLHHRRGMPTINLFAFHLVSQPWHCCSSFLGCRDKHSSHREMQVFRNYQCFKTKLSCSPHWQTNTYHLPRLRSKSAPSKRARWVCQ